MTRIVMPARTASRRCRLVPTEAAIIAAFALATIAACGTAPTETFYTLGPAVTSTREGAAQPAQAAAVAAAASSRALAIVIEQATVPELVDRPQLVVSTGDARVTLLEQQRWAEPLRSQISRTIALDLTALLPTARVSTNGDILDGADEQRSFRVALDVQRFESRPGESVAVEILWTLRRGSGGAGDVVTSGREAVREAASGVGYEGLVSAHNRALAAVSRAIAAAVRSSAN